MSLDKVWAEAATKVLAENSSDRPSAEWFSVCELAEFYGWTDDKTRNYLTRHPRQFEKRKCGVRTWWRIYPSKKAKK